jgi:hypothetical protein
MTDADDRNRNLNQQLEGYEISVQANRGQWKDRLGCWPAYAAAVSSGLALTTAADAGIIYSGPQNVSVTVNNGPGTHSSSSNKPIKMNLAGPANFKISLSFNRSSYLGVVSSLGQAGLSRVGPLKQGNQFISNASGQLKRLAPGSIISSGKKFDTDFFDRIIQKGATNGASTTSRGTWPKSAKGFAGVKFQTGGQTHFGWIRLEWQDTNNVPINFPNKLTAIDWAYNDVAGAPIFAGEGLPQAVPEPSTMALALLAAGSAGVLAWRRRRQEAADATL